MESQNTNTKNITKKYYNVIQSPKFNHNFVFNEKSWSLLLYHNKIIYALKNLVTEHVD